MRKGYSVWRKVFLVCFGIFAGAAFCMKWMEKDLVHNGSVFTIIGLEASYTRDQVASILAGIDGQVKTILRYHLSFDFAFMLGVYPGIAAMCMMARYKTGRLFLRQVLLVLAALQAVAFACDIMENCFLLKWMKNPAEINHFSWYHLVVFTKWILALAGAITAIPFLFKKPKQL